MIEKRKCASIRSEWTIDTARLAQSAERKALNLVVVGSSPTVGVFSCSRTLDIHAGMFTSVNEKVTAVGFEPTPFRTGA